MARNLTKKQQGFIKDYLKTGNGEISARNNYDVANDNTARSIASENLTKPNIVRAIQDAIPDSLLTEKHLALLNKLEVKRTFNQEIGEWIEVETGQIDTNAVSKGLDMAYKLKGAYIDENKPDTRPINLVIPIQVSQSFQIKQHETENEPKQSE